MNNTNSSGLAAIACMDHVIRPVGAVWIARGTAALRWAEVGSDGARVVPTAGRVSVQAAPPASTRGVDFPFPIHTARYTAGSKANSTAIDGDEWY
jgi:hypothetical protein